MFQDPSFVVDIVEAPVVVVVRWDAVTSEVISVHPSFVEIRDVNIAHFIAVAKQNVHSVVVFDEFCQFIGEGVLSLLTLIDPVTWVRVCVLCGLSSPWIAKMSWLKPCSLGQTEYMGRVLVLRWT